MYSANEPLYLLSVSCPRSLPLSGSVSVNICLEVRTLECKARRLFDEGCVYVCSCSGALQLQRKGGKLAFSSLRAFCSLFECVSPEDGTASEQHISVNIRYLFPMPPVNTDKRQHCVVLWLHIPKDYAHSDTPFFRLLPFVCVPIPFF